MYFNSEILTKTRVISASGYFLGHHAKVIENLARYGNGVDIPIVFNIGAAYIIKTMIHRVEMILKRSDVVILNEDEADQYGRIYPYKFPKDDSRRRAIAYDLATHERINER